MPGVRRLKNDPFWDTLQGLYESLFHLIEKTMLAWNEYDFVECLGVLAEYNEDSLSYSYEVKKDNLRLLLTIFLSSGDEKSPADVYLGIYRDGIEEPIFHTEIYKSPGARRIRYKDWECLEIAAPSRYKSYYEENWIVPMGVRIKVYPHISVELFQPEAD